MIKTISFFRLQMAEYLQFTKDAHAIITAANPKSLGIEKQVIDFAATITAMENSYKTERGSAITATITNLDSQRDNLLRGIFSIAEGNVYHFTPALATNAELLLRNINLYGKAIIQQNLQSETASIDSMIADWETKPELTAALNSLNLLDWKNELKATNASFAEAYKNRLVATGQTDSITPFKLVKATSMEAWKKLTISLAAQYYLNESDAAAAAYLGLINTLNALLDKYNDTLQIRKGKATVPDAPTL